VLRRTVERLDAAEMVNDDHPINRGIQERLNFFSGPGAAADWRG
jgi:hypothetical protein